MFREVEVNRDWSLYAGDMIELAEKVLRHIQDGPS